MLGQPGVVEVEDGGNGARVIVAEAVDMFLVVGARRVQREMALEVLEAEEQRGVECLPETVHHPQVLVAGRGFTGLQPLREVAADTFADHLAVAAADRRRGQFAGAGAAAALFGQSGGQTLRHEDALVRPALVDQFIDDALQEWMIDVDVHRPF